MELSTEENKTRLRAQRSAKNISDVIKDLFRSPPSYRTKVVVSWRSPGDKVNKKEAVHVIQFEEAFRPLSAHLDYRKYQATTCQLCKTEVPNSDKEMRGFFFQKKKLSRRIRIVKKFSQRIYFIIHVKLQIITNFQFQVSIF